MKEKEIKKSNFEKAVEIISDEYLEDVVIIDSIRAKTIGDMFKFYEYSSRELKEDFDFILMNHGFDSYSDNLEVLDEDNTIHSFRELLKAVKQVQVN